MGRVSEFFQNVEQLGLMMSSASTRAGEEIVMIMFPEI
jgi:hypothetical protein